ncbi:MAG: hypothetical protein ACYC46_15660 [Acidobacteriaceae bacterium]
MQISLPLPSVFGVAALLIISPWMSAQSRSQASLPDCPSHVMMEKQDTGSKSHLFSTSSTNFDPAVISKPVGLHKASSGLHRTVEPWQAAPQLNWKNKFHMVANTELSRYASITALRAAAYEQIVGGNPDYGPGAEGFGKRLGIAYFRQGSQRFLSDGVMASVLREDPRYYRQGTGGIPSRFWHAVSRTFVTRTDSGATTFNYAAWLGRAEAAGLTVAYYPEESREGHSVLTTFRSSIIGMMASDTLREFWPTWRSVFHPKEQPTGLAAP